MENCISFKGNDPGAVKYGNFINYYQFHPAEYRINQFPKHLWKVNSDHDFVCLDIGCNTGDLTQIVYEFLSRNLTISSENNKNDESTNDYEEKYKCHVLGVDIDPVLLERAQETNRHTSNIKYQCLDFMKANKCEVLAEFLGQHNKTYFDVIFCFSVTMWIHLNYGDKGLRQFLLEVCKWTTQLVVEPQPWKCYRTAVRRLKRAGDYFPKFENLKLRHSVEYDIENILQNECNFVKIMETPPTKWGRKTVFYRKDMM